tara:strand:- start:168 stop:797 length:630 start_codon:yes stop_codon:yes gene_type:complete
MNNELIKRIISSIILIPIALFFIIKGSFFFIFFICICFCIIVYEWNMMSKNKPYYFYGLFFLIFSFLSIYSLRIDANDYLVTLLVATICVSTDIGGYVFGKLFKGPKLTKYSPNKTYAGMVGGYFLSLISVTVIPFFKLDLMQFSEFLFVIGISSVSQIGDIVISYFKRLSKIKDTGKIIPGHGGLLDRVDGMIFAFPFAFIILFIGPF